MSRYTEKFVYDAETLIVEASTVDELEKNMAFGLSQISAGRVVTQILAAGSGQGHVFSVSIEHGVGEGYDPALIELRAYFATGPREQTVQRQAALDRFDPAMYPVDTIAVGGSDGALVGAIIVGATSEALVNRWLEADEWWVFHGVVQASDQNIGTDPAEPLDSIKEFVRRQGLNPLVDHRILVHVFAPALEPGSEPEAIVMEATFHGTAAAVVFRGEYQNVQQSGLVGVWVDHSYNPAPNGTEGYFTDSLGAFMSGGVAHIIEFTETATGDVYYSIGSAVDAATSKQLRTAQPTRVLPPSPSDPYRIVAYTPAPGDGYAFAAYPVVGGLNLKANVIKTSGGYGTSFAVERLWVQSTNWSTYAVLQYGGASVLDGQGKPSLQACGLLGTMNDSQVVLASCFFGIQNSAAGTRYRFVNSRMTFMHHCGGGAVFDNCVVDGTNVYGGQSYFDGASSPVLWFTNGTRVGALPMSCGFYDVQGGAAVQVDVGSEALFGATWGLQGALPSAACAWVVDGSAWYMVLPRIQTGTAPAPSDCDIGGTNVNYSGGGNILPWANVVTNGVGGNTAMLIGVP